MTTEAKGTFAVNREAQPWGKAESSAGQNSELGRFLLEKQFHGDLEGTSEAQMLSAGNPAKGWAGYVAIEKFSGSLHGRKGSFVLQHSGSMANGMPQLSISVVPGSGAGELTGLGGAMSIEQQDGQHAYRFCYTLATIE